MSVNKPCDVVTPPRLGPRRPGCLTPCADVTVSLHEDGAVFFDAVAGRLLSANRVGAEVWRAVTRGLELEDIAMEIAGGYGIAYGTALADAERFLGELERHGLVAEGTAR